MLVRKALPGLFDYPAWEKGIRGFEWEKRISIDFEWSGGGKPTIVGLSAGGQAASSYYSAEERRILAQIEENRPVWIGHNFITADRPVLEKELGTVLPLDRCEDTLLRHYLCNAHLCKAGERDEDEDEKSGAGYMDLWSAASLYTSLPQWKACRGSACSGPCPQHDVLGYNAMDALAADLLDTALRKDCLEKRIPEELYRRLKELTEVCLKMEQQGIRVEMDHVRKLEEEFQRQKDSLFPRVQKNVGKKKEIWKESFDAPFNPRSSKQIIEWFQSKGISLRNTSKEELERARKRLPKRVEEEARKALDSLIEYKNAGKGFAPWFNEKYLEKDGLIHPRFTPAGTSTGRLASSKPNFQNVPRVGFGKLVRAAVVPRDSGLILAKADYSQLELRVCLWYAEAPMPDKDAFTWLTQQVNFPEINGKTPRDVAKSVSHAGNYGEGLVVLYADDLEKSYTKKAVESGSLLIFRDWEYCGGVIGFTGVNLAERLFGSAAFENRKKALAIQELYFSRFPELRAWQRKVSRMAEEGFVRTASGRFLRLCGMPEERLKMALACFGQGGGADYVQEAMLRYYRMGFVPLLQVHDELVFEVPSHWGPAKIREFFSVMSQPSDLFPGFACPVKIAAGGNWLECKEI